MAVKSVKKVQPLKQDAPVERQGSADPATQSSMIDEQTRQRIAERAYYRAQQRGFSPGYELDDWFAAEAEVRNAARRDA